LASYENKSNELQNTLNFVLLDQNDILGQLTTSRKIVENLYQELVFGRGKLQS
jgi:hypothetical protein